jgi:hypothetical protein
VVRDRASSAPPPDSRWAVTEAAVDAVDAVIAETLDG